MCPLVCLQKIMADKFKLPYAYYKSLVFAVSVYAEGSMNWKLHELIWTGAGPPLYTVLTMWVLAANDDSQSDTRAFHTEYARVLLIQ